MNDLMLDHVAIPVRDPLRSRAFYEGVLGLPLQEAMSGDDWDGHPWLLMLFGLSDGPRLALACFKGASFRPEHGLPADARHYALATRDLSPWRERLHGAGIAFREEDHGAQQSLYFEDPDGVVLEVTCPPTAELFAGASDGTHGAEAARTVESWAKRS